MAVYCNECGAGNPDDSEFCSRCGAAIVAAPVLAGNIVLPDWLTRAAGEDAPSAPFIPRSDPAAPESPAPAAAAGPIPSGDLAAAIPSWLRAPVESVATAQAEESLLKDPTDTRGFISEDDLPAWIRQIALADAQRKIAPEAKAAPPVEANPEVPAAASAPLRRRLLPGEVEAVKTSQNAWLTRGDRPQTDTGAAAQSPAERAAPVPLPATMDSLDSSSGSTKPKFNFSGGNTLRYALIAAIVLVLLIVIFVVAL